jgi:LacI family transcriptional regulator
LNACPVLLRARICPVLPKRFDTGKKVADESGYAMLFPVMNSPAAICLAVEQSIIFCENILTISDDLIYSQIESKRFDLKRGWDMATIRDVAKRAGVSVSTASLALNGKKNVSSRTREKVLAAARELNYQKNAIASALKRNLTKTVVLILSELSGPYYSELIQGVQESTIEHGYDLIACSAYGGPDSTATRFLLEKRVDGAVVFAHQIDDAMVLEAAKEDFPVVVLDRSVDGPHVISVEVDNFRGALEAVEYLIGLGHTRIGYVSGPASSRDNQERFKGYLEALNRNSLPYREKWTIGGNFTWKGGYRAARMLVGQGDLPDAVFFANDEMALGGLKAFSEQGIRIPEDLSVIGFDEIQLAGYVRPALTTVRQPKYEAGALAARLLFQALKGENPEKRVVLSTELIIRDSTSRRI